MIQTNQVIPEKYSGEASRWSNVVCWSRMQAEAGQRLHEIIRRKELERTANNGVFCWGVGNAPNKCTADFARSRADVDVLFSIMKSRPKLIDSAPATTLLWRRFLDYQGREVALPKNSLVTSRGESLGGAKRNHFALLCRSDSPLVLSDYGAFDPGAYRNVGVVGGAIGPSQVTALLRRMGDERSDGSYRVNLKAKMSGSFWVKLVDPIPMGPEKQAALSYFMENQNSATKDHWSSFVQQIREDEELGTSYSEMQLDLL